MLFTVYRLCDLSLLPLQECKLCQDCLKADQLDTLERSYLEHNNRLTWRRVVPKPFSVSLYWLYLLIHQCKYVLAYNQHILITGIAGLCISGNFQLW